MSESNLSIKKPESVESIAQQLKDAGFPNEVYIGRVDGQWPLQVWSGDLKDHVAEWMLGERSRRVVSINISRGIVREVIAVEKITERHLEVKQ